MTESTHGYRSQPPPQRVEPPAPPPKRQFQWAWVLGPLAVLGMAYLLGHTKPAVTWEQIMDLLHVHNRERYTMLLHLCLALTFVVAAVRILSRKNKD
jgi:hypothetical protein